MAFCPKCGASLKVKEAPAEAVPPVTYRRGRTEKHEKREKTEKTEKHEKTEKYERTGIIGQFIAGLILILVGFVLYLQVAGYIQGRVVWALFFVVVGIIIIAGTLVATRTAGRRNPKV
jgi:uncharacterized membrane protein